MGGRVGLCGQGHLEEREGGGEEILVLLKALAVPADSHPGVGDSRGSHSLGWRLVRYFGAGEGGEDQVVVRGDERVLLPTDDTDEGLRQMRGRGEEQHVQLAVRGSPTHEMVVCGVAEVQPGQGELGQQIGEEQDPRLVVGVDIGVTTNKDRGSWVVLLKGLQHCSQGSKGQHKLLVPTACREVETDVGTGGETRDRKDDGKDCRRGGGEEGDEWVQGRVPEAESPPLGLATIQSQVRIVEVLTVEVVAVWSEERGQGQAAVTLEQLGLRQEEKGRLVRFDKM